MKIDFTATYDHNISNVIGNIRGRVKNVYVGILYMLYNISVGVGYDFGLIEHYYSVPIPISFT